MYLSNTAQDKYLTTQDVINYLPQINTAFEQISLIEEYIRIRKIHPTYMDKNFLTSKRENYTRKEIGQITDNLNKETKKTIIKAFCLNDTSLYCSAQSIEVFNRIRKIILKTYSFDDIQELIKLDRKKNPKFMQHVFQNFVQEAENIEKLLLIFKEKEPVLTQDYMFSLLEKIIQDSPTAKSFKTGIKAFEKVFGVSCLEYNKLLTAQKTYANEFLECLFSLGAEKLFNQDDKSGMKMFSNYLKNNNLLQCKTIVRFLDIKNEQVLHDLNQKIEQLKSSQMPHGKRYSERLIKERMMLGYELEKILLELSMVNSNKSDKININTPKKLKI